MRGGARNLQSTVRPRAIGTYGTYNGVHANNSYLCLYLEVVPGNVEKSVVSTGGNRKDTLLPIDTQIHTHTLSGRKMATALLVVGNLLHFARPWYRCHHRCRAHCHVRCGAFWWWYLDRFPRRRSCQNVVRWANIWKTIILAARARASTCKRDRAPLLTVTPWKTNSERNLSQLAIQKLVSASRWGSKWRKGAARGSHQQLAVEDDDEPMPSMGSCSELSPLKTGTSNGGPVGSTAGTTTSNIISGITQTSSNQGTPRLKTFPLLLLLLLPSFFYFLQRAYLGKPTGSISVSSVLREVHQLAAFAFLH